MEKDLYSFAVEQHKNLSRVIDVSAGICPLGPSKKVKAAIRKAVGDIDRYPDPESRRLKKFFSSRFGIDESGILFANSLNGLLTLASSVFGPDRLVIISNPDRISGRLTDRKELFEALAEMAGKGRMVVLDESLIEFTADDKFYDGICGIDNIIVLRTTANFYGVPGLELAWAVASPGTISVLKGYLPWSANALSAEAAMTAIKDKTYIKAAKKFIRDERSMLFYELRRINGVKVSESDSNVFILKIGTDPEKVMTRLSEAGFLVKDCSGVNGLDKSFLRMSVMSHDMNRKLIRLLRETCLQQITPT